jgi:pyruvate kinase
MSVRHTKIVCTLGPASSGRAVLADMIRSGMDVARVNMSHGTHTSHARTIRLVRSLAEQLGRTVGIMADLQGPKLRTGVMQTGGVDLQEGASITLDLSHEPGTESRIPIQAEEFFRMVARGDRFVIDDGLLELAVLDITETKMRAEVIHGGLLKDNKGINLLNDRVAVSPLTDKDRVDLEFAVQQEVDWIALSFVQGPENVAEVKGLMYGLLPTGAMPIPVMSKIEKPGAVTAIDDIMALSDGIMVARGDLGIETGPERVPLIQKDLIRRCNLAGMPVVTATQMLESMIHNPRPSRAEASDVANAVIDGTDCIMLSGETAMGRDPAHVIRTMASIVAAVEDEFVTPLLRSESDADDPAEGIADSVARSTVHLVDAVGASAILTPTASGGTAKNLSRFRPSVPIVALTPNPRVRSMLTVHHGIQSLPAEDHDTSDEVIQDAIDCALDSGLVEEGDRVVITAGTVIGQSGMTNMITVRSASRPLFKGVGQGSKRVMGSCVQLEEILQKNGIVDPQECILVAPKFTPECIEFASRSLGLITGCSAEAVAAMLPEGVVHDWLAIYGAVGDFSRVAECPTLIMDTITGRVFDLAQVRNI